MITPTVGRVCLYQKTHEDSWPYIEGQPYAALVCAVLPSGNVNLTVFDSEAGVHTKLNVAFTENPEPGHPFWMEYQKSQAQKHASAADLSVTRPTHILGQPVDASASELIRDRRAKLDALLPAERDPELFPMLRQAGLTIDAKALTGMSEEEFESYSNRVRDVVRDRAAMKEPTTSQASAGSADTADTERTAEREESPAESKRAAEDPAAQAGSAAAEQSGMAAG